MCYGVTWLMPVATDLFCLVEAFGASTPCCQPTPCAKKIYFEARVLNRQGLFAGLQNIELVSISRLDRAKNYCQMPSGWAQYKGLILVLMPTPFILTNYSGLLLLGSAEDQTRVWTISLSEYVFMSSAMFVIGARNGACTSYYTLNHWFDNLSGSLLSPLLDKLLNVLRYFCLYKLRLQMGTDPLMTAKAIHQ